MSNVEKTTIRKAATEKMVTIHMIAVFVVCVAFGTISLISKQVPSALATYGLGIIVPVVVFLLKNKATTIRGRFISIAQCFMVIFLSITKGELHHMFPLLLASMTMAGIYFDKPTLIIHWIIADVIMVAAIFFKDTTYVNADTALLLKGILGINIGAAMVLYLVSCSVRFIDGAHAAYEESGRLLEQVRTQMAESAELTQNQAAVVRDITEISATLNKSSAIMLDVSINLNEASEEQTRTISQIYTDFEDISVAISESNSESTKSAIAAQKSTEMIAENNEEMRHVVAAMADINAASKKIEGIIKTIEDIAFQTNILALNAAVEAARAGAAGKSFAVVAEEVRNLANKSAEAANNTSALIQASIDSIGRGTTLAQKTAERMKDVISYSEQSAAHAGLIDVNLDKQSKLIDSLKARMENISHAVEKNSQISIESADLAKAVLEEAEKMNLIVSGNSHTMIAL